MKKAHLSITQALAAILMLAGCSPHDATVKHTFETFSDEHGIVQAVTRGGPKYKEPLFTFEMVTTLIEDPEHEESMLFRPNSMRMDEDGWIYVVDSGNRRIAVFDQEGQYHHSFGHEGQGPGEFSAISLQSVSGDSLTIFDSMNSRTTVYRRDGTLLSVTSLSFLFRVGVNEIHLHSDGRKILIGQPLIAFSSASTESYNELWATIISQEGDTLAVIETPQVPYGRTFLLEEYSRVGYGRTYYMGWPVLHYSPDHGLLMSTGMEPVLTWYDLDGNITRVITIEEERAEVTAEDRAALMNMSRDTIENASNEASRAMAQRMHELMEIPYTKDHWTRVELDDSGFMWLKYVPDYTVEPAYQNLSWKVLSPEGEYLGDAVRPLQYGTISHGHFLGFVTDEETGEMTGTVYRIVPAIAELQYP